MLAVIICMYSKEENKIIKKYVLCLLVVCLFHCQHESLFEDIPEPPEAKVDVVLETIHGIEIRDPYRYMENLENSSVIEWMRAQNDYAREVLSKIPGRDELKAQIKEIAQRKMKDLNSDSIEQSMKIIEGTARGMGIVVED